MKFFADAILDAPPFLLLGPPRFNRFARAAKLVNGATLVAVCCDRAVLAR